MSAREPGIDARDEAVLHAYHDGELRGLARWRFGRRLARSPELARELALLRALRRTLREREAAAPAPDLWDRIEQRLPAVEARRDEARRAATAPDRRLPWLRPLGAVAAAAAVAAIALRVLLPGDVGAPGSVRWIDSGARNVIVFDDEDTTIIWVLDGPADDASRGGSRAFSTFS